MARKVYQLRIRTRQVSDDPHRQAWTVEITHENGKLLEEPVTMFEWLRKHSVNSCTIAVSVEETT